MLYTVFAGHRRLATGPLAAITQMVAEAQVNGSEQESLLVFDDRTGRVVDVDTRGTPAAVEAPLVEVPPVDAPQVDAPQAESAAPRAPGRPRLGVVAREVTLLPHHWE